MRHRSPTINPLGSRHSEPNLFYTAMNRPNAVLPVLMFVITMFVAIACIVSPITKKSFPPLTPKDLQAATVLVVDVDGGVGSGIVFNYAGKTFIWTCAHCVDNGQPPTIVKGKDMYVPKILEVDKDADIAVLVIPKPNTFSTSVSFSSVTPSVGTHIQHVGNFFGPSLVDSYSEGVVSFVGRESEGHIFDQVSAPIFPGSSGGGIFLDNGQCIGIVEKQAASTVTFVIPSRVLLEWAKKHNLIDATAPLSLQ